jgi:outer membrane protein assembly factor BamB
LPSQPTWTVPLGGRASYPIIANGLVSVVVTDDTSGAVTLLALREADGSVAWGPIQIGTGAAQAYDDGRILITNPDGAVRSFDQGTGQPEWSITLNASNGGLSPPVATNGLVYIGAPSKVYALRAWNGVEVWADQVQGDRLGLPAVAGNILIAEDVCHVFGFTADNGYFGWYDDFHCGGGQTAASVIGSGKAIVYTPTGGHVVMDPGTGTISGELGNGNLPPAIGGSKAFFVNDFTGVAAVDLATNQTAWTFPLTGRLNTPPLLIDNTLIVVTDAGVIYGLDSQTGGQTWTAQVGPISPAFPDNVGMGAGDGLLVVPRDKTISAWRIIGP